MARGRQLPAGRRGPRPPREEGERRFSGRFVIAFASVLAAGAAQAQVVGPIQFTEPELPQGTIVNGLTLSTLNGVPILPVSFVFEIGGGPSGDCTVSGGPGTTTFVSDRSMGGAPGTLSTQLSGDANDFRFGFAVAPGGGQEPPPFVGGRPTSGFWTPGGRGIRTLGMKAVGALAVTGAVQLTGYTDGGAVAGSASFDALDNPGDAFPGNLAALSTVTPFRRVVVQWNAAGVGRFALDNLAVRLVAGPAAVPALSGAGLAALAAALVAAGIAILPFRG